MKDLFEDGNTDPENGSKRLEKRVRFAYRSSEIVP